MFHILQPMTFFFFCLTFPSSSSSTSEPADDISLHFLFAILFHSFVASFLYLYSSPSDDWRLETRPGRANETKIEWSTQKRKRKVKCNAIVVSLSRSCVSDEFAFWHRIKLLKGFQSILVNYILLLNSTISSRLSRVCLDFFFGLLCCVFLGGPQWTQLSLDSPCNVLAFSLHCSEALQFLWMGKFDSSFVWWFHLRVQFPRLLYVEFCVPIFELKY